MSEESKQDDPLPSPWLQELSRISESIRLLRSLIKNIQGGTAWYFDREDLEGFQHLMRLQQIRLQKVVLDYGNHTQNEWNQLFITHREQCLSEIVRLVEPEGPGEDPTELWQKQNLLLRLQQKNEALKTSF